MHSQFQPFTDYQALIEMQANQQLHENDRSNNRDFKIHNEKIMKTASHVKILKISKK